MLLWIAAGWTFIVACLHTFVGGPQLVTPLLKNSQMDEPVKLLFYYCWHIVTFILFGLAMCFAYAAYSYDGKVLGIVASITCSFFVVWSFGLVVWKKQKHKDMPQWILFIPSVIFGVLGLI